MDRAAAGSSPPYEWLTTPLCIYLAACAVAVLCGLLSVGVATQPDEEPRKGAAFFLLLSLVAAGAASAAGAAAIQARAREPRSEARQFWGCLGAGLLLACIVTGLFWLTYVVSFAVGWGEHNWAEFQDEIGLGLIWIVVAFTSYSLFWGAVSGIPAAMLIWAFGIRPRDGAAHSRAVSIAGGAMALGYALAFVFSMGWGRSGEEVLSDDIDCSVPGQCQIAD